MISLEKLYLEVLLLLRMNHSIVVILVLWVGVLEMVVGWPLKIIGATSMLLFSM